MSKFLAVALMVLGAMGLAVAQGGRAGPQGQPPAVQPNQPRPQLPPGTATLTGTVVVMGSGQPIPNASLELRRTECSTFSNPPEVVTATTDGDGRFTFQNLRAGGWCIVATVAGGAYTPAEYMQRGVLGRGATITIVDGQRVAGIQLAMAPTGGIAGRVRDADGEAMAHARVQVMEPFSEEGQRRLYILQVAQTNDLGEYRFYWLPPGPYYIAVIPENTRGRNVVSVQPPPGTGGHREDVIAPVIMPRITPRGELIEETFVPVYYPSETESERAQPIQVQPGNTTSGVDIVLSTGKVRSFHIRGVARNAVNGEAAAGAQLRLAPKKWSATVVMPTATADQAGNFDIAGVVPGSYVLMANMSMPDPAAPPVVPGVTAAAQPPGATPPPRPIPLTANQSVDVSGGAVENVQLLLVPGISVAGRITIEGATAAANPQRGLSVNLVREPDVVGIPNATARGMVQEDGTFTVQNVGPGEYRVYVPPLISPFQWGAPNTPQPLQNMYVKSVRMGNEDLLRSRLRIDGAVSGPIEVAIGPGGRFTGNVMNERREAAPNVTVVLVPDGVFRQRRDLYRTANTDVSGRFSMQGVPAATYKAFAFEETSVDAWQGSEFLRPLESRGTTVEIRDGNQTTTDLQLIPATRR